MKPDHEAAKEWAEETWNTLKNIVLDDVTEADAIEYRNAARAYLDLVSREQHAEAAERERDALKAIFGKCAGRFARVRGQCEPVEGYAERPNDILRSIDDLCEHIAALKQRVAELERELEAARKVASCLHDFATAHERWEAALIMDDAAWSGGMAAWPTLNETLYAGMMELQRQRAAALVTYDLAVYRATKEPRDDE